MRQSIFLLLIANTALSVDLAITSAVYSNSSLTLSWPRTLASDPHVFHVFNVERRHRLDDGTWESVAVENVSGLFTDATPPAQSGFYRLKESEYPLAVFGPDGSSSSQGVGLVSPERADVLFFKPLTGPPSQQSETTNSLTVVVNGAYRATVFFSSARQGLTFRYRVSGSSLTETLNFNQGEARLTTPEFSSSQSVAEQAAAAAQDLVRDLFRRYPDSATVWQDIGSGEAAGTNNEATVLYVRAKTMNTNQGALPRDFGSDVQILAQPLVSGEELVPASQISTTAPFSPELEGMVNLNATNALHPDAWIGYRSVPVAGAPVTAAHWVYVGRDSGPTNANNPPVARYAYWVEDESFKVNVNIATNGLRGIDSGTSPKQATIDGVLAATGNLDSYTNQTQTMLQRRTDLGPDGFPDVASAAEALGVEGSTEHAEFRFLTTVNSAGLDLSRSGFKRFNINAITNDATDPLDTDSIRTNLNRVLAAITNTNAVPHFGQRFYRLTDGTVSSINSTGGTSGVTAEHATIYVQKIAANILDYVDANDQPTLVNNDEGFSIRAGKPSYGIEARGGALNGASSVAAMGIENTPRLQEYAIHARIRKIRHTPSNPDSFGFNSADTAPRPTSAEFEIWIDHYFEFWNSGTRDYTFPEGSFLKVYNQPGFGTSVTGPLAANDRETSEIPLQGITMRAGHTLVLTTAQPGNINAAANASSNGFALIDTTMLASLANLVSLPTPDADRRFFGTTADVRTATYSGYSGPNFPYDRLFEIRMRPRSTPLSDYRSSVLVGNNQGVIESFVGLPIGATSANTPALSLCVSNGYIRDSMEGVGILGAGNNDFLLGGSLRGNSAFAATPSSTEGDPRALNEQLYFTNHLSGSSNTDQTRFYATISGDGRLPGESTMGRPNTNFVFANRWVDYSSLQEGDTNAPLVVRNGPMQSIGELGHLTDPARVAGPGGINLSRGGGRTLRVGQPEHPLWYDNQSTNASRTWASWRLADIFTTTSVSSGATASDAQGVLTNAFGVVRGATNTTDGASVTIRGLINPNGMLRDGGAAWRATMHGMRFLPAESGLGEARLAGKDVNVDALITSLRTRLTNTLATGMPTGSINPFWERGELSELTLFNAGSTLAGVAMANVFDRGREELVRRTIEMITPRGSVFTVYAVGQSLQGSNIVGTARLKQTFQVEPQFASFEALDDSFDPANVNHVSRRFSAPTNFSIIVLGAEISE